MHETVSPELFVSSISRNGQSKVFRNPQKVSLTSLDKFIKPKSSSVKKAPSRFTAVRAWGKPGSSSLWAQYWLESRVRTLLTYFKQYEYFELSDLRWCRQRYELIDIIPNHFMHIINILTDFLIFSRTSTNSATDLPSSTWLMTSIHKHQIPCLLAFNYLRYIPKPNCNF